MVAFETRQAGTAADDCNIADVLFISQIYNVKPELKHNSEQMLRLTTSSHHIAKPNVGRRLVVTTAPKKLLLMEHYFCHYTVENLTPFHFQKQS